MSKNEVWQTLMLLHDELIDGDGVFRDELPAILEGEPALLLLFLGEAMATMVLRVDDEAQPVEIAGEIVIAQRMLGHAVVDVKRAKRLVDSIPGPQKEPVAVPHLQIALSHGPPYFVSESS